MLENFTRGHGGRWRKRYSSMCKSANQMRLIMVRIATRDSKDRMVYYEHRFCDSQAFYFLTAKRDGGCGALPEGDCRCDVAALTDISRQPLAALYSPP